jgi:protein-export membrane protein SecD
MLFMILFYRLPGLIASLALFIYVVLLLALFKLIPVTLTLAGIAGFILSIGMAVDGNVLIFSRMREELKEEKPLTIAIEEGFRRAWSSIRDGNVTTLLVALILFGLGSSFIKGFALTLSLGILMSLFSAIFVTRTFLLLLAETKLGDFKRLWG